MQSRPLPLQERGNARHTVSQDPKQKPVLASSTSDLSSINSRKHKLEDVVDLIKDIMEYLRLAEVKFLPNPSYMGWQTDITERMRAILIDWLAEVHQKFKLVPETLHLTVPLIDRFLGHQQVTRMNLQLVGVVAMLIASKYEEIYPPEIRDFIFISANTYSRDQVLKMEETMLNSLEFKISCPTVYPFVRRALEVVDAEVVCQHLALYISELALLDYSMLPYGPSITGAGCVFVARKIVRHSDPWNYILEHYTNYTAANMKTVGQKLYDLVIAAPGHRCQAIRKKYSTTRFSSVAEIVPMGVTFS